MIERTMQLTSQIIEDGSEETLLIAAARKEPREFGALYERYANRVFRYLYSRTKDLQTAEDITSQTFLSAFESFGRFRGDGHFSSWLFGIARHKVNDHFRKHRMTTSLDAVTEISDEHDTLANAVFSDESAGVQRLIKQLSEKEQELLRLRFLAELSYAKIARLVHRSEGAVKKSIYRLLARVQSRWENENE